MKLYYAPGACSLASDIVLHEADLDASYVKVDLKTKKTEAGEDFRAINPKGYVPTLELDDGDRLTENVAVLQYLASLKPGLLPQEGKAKWHALEKLAFVSTELHKGFKPLFDPTASDEAKAKAKELLASRFALLAEELRGRQFAVGDRFSVVDAYLFVMLRWAEENQIPLPESLREYAKAMKRRKSVREALKNEGLPEA